MPFDLEYWKAAVKAYLPQAKKDFKRGVYNTLSAAAFLPLLVAFQDPATTAPAMMALWNILSGLGSNHLAGKLQTWGEDEAPDLETLAEHLQASIEENVQVRKELDAMLKALEMVDQAHAELNKKDKAWFQETLQAELSQLNSNLRVIYTDAYFEKLVIENGDFVNRDKITIITYIYQGEDVTHLVRGYYQNLSDRCQRLPLGIIDEKFINPQGDSPIRLQDIYTHLDVAAIQAAKDEDAQHYGWRLSRAEEGDREPILDAAANEETPFLTLLGDAGSGKTTFINYLTYRLLANPNGMPEILQNRPIIRLVLRDVLPFMSSTAEPGTAECLWEALKADIQKRVGDDIAPKVMQAIQQKVMEAPCLVLLDGLDEIPEAHQHRQHLIEAIQDLITCLAEGSRVILTARPYAYANDEWRLSGFQIRTMKPFSDGQAAHFINAWYHYVPAPQGEGRQILQNRANDLIKAIREKDYLGAMASRPILLTLMTTLHTSRGTLPEDRAELYDDSVNLLIDRWQQKYRRGTSSGPESPSESGHDPRIQKIFQFGTTRVRKVMERIAFDSHQKQQAQQKDDPEAAQQSADITRPELESAFSPILPDDLNPRVVVDYLAQNAGLLIAREPDIFIFPHRSFQEFLAACHLLNQPDATQKLLRLIHEDLNWWREVFLLAAGKQKSGGLNNAASLISALKQDSISDRETITDQDWHEAALAGEGLLEIRLLEDAESRQAYAGLINRIRGWLTNLVAEGHLTPKARLEAGDVLGGIGDRRKGVNVILHNDVVIPDIDWVPIPPGEFLMGSADSDAKAYKDEKPQHSVRLPKYWISRFPLTNAQYAPFIKAGGYQDSSFWTEAGWAWRQGADRDFSEIENDRVRKVYEQNQAMRPKDRRGEPYAWREKPWNGATRPVVGICWYEAQAYTQWLSRRLQDHRDLLQEGVRVNWAVTLPSEAEWEKAVRGPEGLTYPWGNQWKEEAANIEETNLNTTSVVGMFGNGKSAAFGLLDGAGNVWEWTRSLWGGKLEEPDFTYPYDPEDPEREALEDARRRVVRGGSFYHVQNYARCAFRHRLNPVNWNINFGFRLCLRP